MPIHLSILKPRLAEGGKVKIGGLGAERTGKSGRRYRTPERYDHFVITKTIRTAQGENFVVDQQLMDEVAKDPRNWVPALDKNGKPILDDKDQPKKKIVRIPVLFDSDLLDETFPTRLAAYHGRRLFCAGTGDPSVPAVRGIFEKRGEQSVRTGSKPHPCPCGLLEEEIRGVRCKPNGTLWFTILAGERTTLGIRHSFRTNSWNSLRETIASLEILQRRVGTIVNVLCYLVLREVKVEDRKGVMRTIHVVHVELQISDLADLRRLQKDALETVELRNRVAQQVAQPVRLGLPAPAGPHETKQEQALIQQEHYPADEESEQEETLDYDPETGEVYADEAPDDFDQRMPGDEEIIDTTATEVDEPEPRGHRRRQGESMDSQGDAKAGQFEGEPPTEEPPTPPTEPAPKTKGKGKGKSAKPADQGPTLPFDAPPRPDETPDDHVLETEHLLRKSCERLLSEIAKARGATEKDLRAAREKVWAEAAKAATAELGDQPRWRTLTKAQATVVQSRLFAMLPATE